MDCGLGMSSLSLAFSWTLSSAHLLFILLNIYPPSILPPLIRSIISSKLFFLPSPLLPSYPYLYFPSFFCSLFNLPLPRSSPVLCSPLFFLSYSPPSPSCLSLVLPQGSGLPNISAIRSFSNKFVGLSCMPTYAYLVQTSSALIQCFCFALRAKAIHS